MGTAEIHVLTILKLNTIHSKQRNKNIENITLNTRNFYSINNVFNVVVSYNELSSDNLTS
jgi:hypothetical protein